MATPRKLDPRRYLGALIYGGYRLDRVLGVGGFAAVYHARCFDGSEAAVKVLLTDHPQAMKRFAREAKVMRSLPPSPMLVAWRGEGRTEDGRPFIVMEYVDGPTLAQGMRTRPRLPPDEAAVVTYQLTLALAALHRYGIVHRDVKPNNLLMSPDGLVKLFDFGLVLDAEGMLRLFEEEDILSGADFSEDIERGAIAGTPEYMAPEQFYTAVSGVSPVGQLTPASDIFSVGVILYRLLTGRLPLPLRRGRARLKTTTVQRYIHARSLAIESLERPPRVDEALWSIVIRAMSEDPSDRQPNSEAMSSDLFGYLVLGTGTLIIEEEETQITRGMPSGE